MTTTGKTPRITGSARESLAATLVQKYEAGASIRALATEFEKSYGFVHGVLVNSGATLRGRGGATRGRSSV